MTFIKSLLTLLALVVFAITFFTFDLAALDLELVSPTLLRENPFAVGIIGGILLIAVIADRRVENKRIS